MSRAARRLSAWTGRMGLRKAKARRCVCWLKGNRCGWVGSTRKGERAGCQPPGIEHASVWGLGAPPEFQELRALVSQPALADIDEPALEEWCARWGAVCWERPELSWHRPGETTLQVFVLEDDVDALTRHYTSCPSCLATDRWTRRECCGVADLAAWWDTHVVAKALMGGA